MAQGGVAIELMVSNALTQVYSRLSNRPEFSGTVPIFCAMSRIPNFHLIVPNFPREPVTEIGPPKKVTVCLQTLY